MMVVPFGTLTGAPSIVTLTNSSAIKLLLPYGSSESRKHGTKSKARKQHPHYLIFVFSFSFRVSVFAFAFSSNCRHGWFTRTLDIRLELVAELLDPAHDRRGAGIAQNADGLAGHVVGQIQQELEMLLLSLPRQNPLENPDRPGGAFPALGALGAGLVGVEP